jgi:hypothetical protein
VGTVDAMSSPLGNEQHGPNFGVLIRLLLRLVYIVSWEGKVLYSYYSCLEKLSIE